MVKTDSIISNIYLSELVELQGEGFYMLNFSLQFTFLICNHIPSKYKLCVSSFIIYIIEYAL